MYNQIQTKHRDNELGRKAKKKKYLKRTTKKTNLTHEESALPGFGKREEEEESCLHRC